MSHGRRTVDTLRARRPSVDRRPVPRGVLPRGVQTWLMVGLAVGMLLIMLVVGRPEPPARPARCGSARAGARTPTACATIRTGCACSRRRRCETRRQRRWRLQPHPSVVRRTAVAAAGRTRSSQSGSGASTRASSPATSCSAGARERSGRTPVGADDDRVRRRVADGPATPSIDEIADAVVRATVERGDWRAGSAGAAGSATPARRQRGASDERERLARPSAHGPDQRRRPAASRPRRHGHRRGPDESPRRQRGGAGELPGDEPGLLAQRAARADSRWRARARRDEAGSGVRRDAAGRGVSIAC